MLRTRGSANGRIARLPRKAGTFTYDFPCLQPRRLSRRPIRSLKEVSSLGHYVFRKGVHVPKIPMKFAGTEASGHQAREALAARSCKRRMSRPCRDLMMSHIDCVQVPRGSQEVSFGGWRPRKAGAGDFLLPLSLSNPEGHWEPYAVLRKSDSERK